LRFRWTGHCRSIARDRGGNFDAGALVQGQSWPFTTTGQWRCVWLRRHQEGCSLRKVDGPILQAALSAVLRRSDDVVTPRDADVAFEV
jgi:hypothetical protein